MNSPALKKQKFEVAVPNLEGDGIAELVPIEVQAYTDPLTGEDVLTPESLELIEKTKARRMGLLTPKELRELRERLDLTQEEMSDLLQIGAKTFTRWETGRARPSRSLNVLLCALKDGVLSLDYLRSLREGRDWEPLAVRRLQRSLIVSLSGQTCMALDVEKWQAWQAVLSQGQSHSRHRAFSASALQSSGAGRLNSDEWREMSEAA